MPPAQALTARTRAEQELEIGREIQRSFLPDGMPVLPGWELASYFQAARAVSGDFYDAFRLSSAKKVGLVVADVCDKGVGAALFMGLFRSLIRAFADQHYSLRWMDMLPEADRARQGQDGLGRRRSMLSAGATALRTTMQLTNQYIATNHGDANMFATIFFAVLDPASGQLIYANGGHLPPVLLRAGGTIERLMPTGPAVGLLPDIDYELEHIQLEPGDLLVGFTDGAPDALDPDRSFFTEDRLVRSIGTSPGSAQDSIDHLRSALEEHMCGADQYDDITLLALRRAAGEAV